MPDLTSPASVIASPVMVAPPSANAPNLSKPAAFCRVMSDKQFAPKIKPPSDDDNGQDDAATGKDLPEKDKDVDPALSWLLGAPIVLPPTSAPPPAPSAPPTTADPIPSDILVASTSGAPAVATADAAAAGKIADLAPNATDVPTAVDATLAKLANADTAPPQPQPFKLPLPQPAKMLQPFPLSSNPTPAPVAAALPALFALAMGTDRAKSDELSSSSLTPASATSLSQVATALPVAPAGDAQRQMLDMGRQDWPQRMIDHIEALRDNANVNDTSIRLKPEALGRVDIALRTHDNGAISVRFTAEQPTTRTLLVDATPQLSAAAEARGIRLSGTSVDLNGQGDQRSLSHHNAAPERARSTANRLADTQGDDIQAADDGRIA